MSVSLVICCHNSSERLPSTLGHLLQQVSPEDLSWEVVVVDNGSTDGTAEVAAKLWPSDAVAPLRVVREARLGLSWARIRGFSEARHEFVCFVDDDNWLAPEWVQTVAEIMSAHAEAGACGGHVTAACEGPQPEWFGKVAGAYAVGGQDPDKNHFLFGAGLAVRKSAWEGLRTGGFEFLLTDRSGRSLAAGGDSELCFALGLTGWRFIYDPRLQMTHFIPQNRLSWAYTRGLFRGFGAASVYHDAYLMGTMSEPRTLRERWLQSWVRQVLRLLAAMGKDSAAVLAPLRDRPGDPATLRHEQSLGRLQELLRVRGAYATAARKIRQAQWRRRRHTEA